jgi:hypothetical protein
MELYLHRDERGMQHFLYGKMSLSASTVFHIPFCHENHVVRILPYFNFSTRTYEQSGLVVGCAQGTKIPLQLRKIEYIMQKKI